MQLQKHRPQNLKQLKLFKMFYNILHESLILLIQDLNINTNQNKTNAQNIICVFVNLFILYVFLLFYSLYGLGSDNKTKTTFVFQFYYHYQLRVIFVKLMYFTCGVKFIEVFVDAFYLAISFIIVLIFQIDWKNTKCDSYSRNLIH